MKVFSVVFFLFTLTSFISQAQSISITPLQNLSYCACSQLNIDFTTNGNFNPSNIYTAQLSNAFGNFATPTNIGTLNGNMNVGTINCVIPCNILYGTDYRVRIVSSLPAVISPDNGVNITINLNPQVNIILSSGSCADTLTASVPVVGNKYYITNTEPWGIVDNEHQMDVVFGVGGWIYDDFSTPNLATIFSPNTQFVFLEGSDLNANALNQFMLLNGPLIENWVQNGGRLFLNAAPNEGGVQNWGFGGTILNYQNLIPSFINALPGVEITNLAHPINMGPYTPLSPGGSYTGNYFAHANIINGGTTLIHNSINPSEAVLTEKAWGNGNVLFGGMTLSFFHNNVAGLVNQHAVNLRQNILSYAAGGAANPLYGYAWAPGGEITSKIMPSNTGIYTVTVTSNAGCTATATYNYTQQNAAPNVHITTIGDLCQAGNNIVLDAGAGFFSYTWDNGDVTQTRTINSAGTYWVTVTNAHGCVATDTIIINYSSPMNLTIVSSPILCHGDSTSMTVNVSGGVSPYQYSVNGGAFQGNNQFGNLQVGTYTILVSDAVGCTATSVVSINEPTILSFSQVNVHEVYCNGDSSGSIAVVSNGGVGNIVYSIMPSKVQVPEGFFKYLNAGVYTIVATDANGCSITTTANVTENPLLQIKSLSFVEPICAYDSTGIIQTSAIGGVAPIMYSINNGAPNLSGVFTGLVIAPYSVSLIDNLGCRKDTVINLTGPSLVGATIQIEPTKCVDSEDGKLTVQGTGGLGGYKYFVTPDLNLNKSGIFLDLTQGIYTVRVVDTVGCEYETKVTISGPSVPLKLSITKEDLKCYGRGNEGFATVDVNGGAMPYVYKWSTDPVQNTATASNLYFGWYSVQVTDANGCEKMDTVYISEGSCCEIAFVPNAFSPNGDQVNDEFRVLTTSGIELIQLEIYDRWGQKVWTTSEWKRGWDGRIDGADAAVGTYYFVLNYRCTLDNKTYLKKGDVTLVR
ncbi:MAG: fibronectin type III domain-containing protein [Bacteroidetes bacterium OLB11]|nr:MAG: fibronectin type III domain-containing protein [Bacteroidetes bacterium OLB11]